MTKEMDDVLKREHFFTEIKSILDLQNEQKKRGLNDYNLLTSVLKAGDEVRLHSRFLYSMLNPNGVHFQDDLFLKLFFELVLGEPKSDYINNFEVKREKDSIDLLITDGEKYYIIENKIFAEDQPRQIARYVMTVKDEYDADIDNIFVYYLSPKSTPPSRSSLGKFIIKGTKLHWDSLFSFEGEKKHKVDKALDVVFNSATTISYKKISYKNEILDWVNNCLKETENLTNLNHAFTTYKDVIERIIKTRKSKVTTITESLINNPEQLILAREVEKALPKVKGTMLFNFFKKIQELDCIKKLSSSSVVKGDESTTLIKQYTLENCIKWFDPSKKNRKHIGLFIDLNKDYRLCVMVAAKMLHIGIISNKPLDSKSPQYLEITSTIKLNLNQWKSKPLWYSYTPISEPLSDFNTLSIKFLSESPERIQENTAIAEIVSKYQD